MGRAAYCRRQAALCREVAAQLSLHADVERVRRTALAYDREADVLDEAAEASRPAGVEPSSGS
jgi:hypothetical protein